MKKKRGSAVSSQHTKKRKPKRLAKNLAFIVSKKRLSSYSPHSVLSVAVTAVSRNSQARIFPLKKATIERTQLGGRSEREREHKHHHTFTHTNTHTLTQSLTRHKGYQQQKQQQQTIYFKYKTYIN